MYRLTYVAVAGILLLMGIVMLPFLLILAVVYLFGLLMILFL